MSSVVLSFFGALQGITEFLPISSSGHLLFFRSIFIAYDQPLVTDIVLHLGSLLAIIYFFADTLKKHIRKLIFPLFVSVIPAGLSGLFLLDKIELLFYSPKFLFLSFLFTTLILLLFSQLKWRKTSINKITSKKALQIGIFQTLALVPGISRSASTIFAGKLVGLDSVASFSFSFIMAIPAILGSVFLSLIKLDFISITFDLTSLVMGFFSSFIFSLLTLKILQKIIKQKSLSNFAYYTIILSAVSFVLFV